MNYTTETREALLREARTLFAQLGYDGASIRRITKAANANLGAVTYHFGSKEALYEAAAESLMLPMRERIVAAVQVSGTPMQRLEHLVRAVFTHLQANPDLPRFIVQLIASSRPLPPRMAEMLRGNHRLAAETIAEGQADGTIRSGDPRLLALSIVAQPIWLSIVRRPLQQAIQLDQDDQQTRAEVIENAVRFVRAGLSPRPEES